MRISDWSSDVCSSDLGGDARGWRHRPSRPALYATAGPRSLHGSGDRAARQVIVTPRHLRQEEAMKTHVSPRGGDERMRDRKRGVRGKRVKVRVELGGGRISIKKH